MTDSSFAHERLIPGALNSLAVAHLHRYAIATKFVSGQRVLDIACGAGYGSELLARIAKRVVGADISSETVAEASRRYSRPNLCFSVCSADVLPFSDASFDVAVSFETIEHHDKHEEMVRELRRVLTPEGLLIISSPDRHNYSDRQNYRNPFHVKELYRHEFETLLRATFRHCAFYEQRMLTGSLIVPTGPIGEIAEISGGFDQLTHGSLSGSGTYVIALASEQPLNEIQASYFDGEAAHANDTAEITREIAAAIRGSCSYRLGHALLAPLRALRAIVRR